MGIGRSILGAALPAVAGYFGGPALAGATGWGTTASSIAAGALAGGGIAALSGGDILGGAAMGGLSGLGGGSLQGAFNPATELGKTGLTSAEFNAVSNIANTGGSIGGGAGTIGSIGSGASGTGVNLASGAGKGINNLTNFASSQGPSVFSQGVNGMASGSFNPTNIDPLSAMPSTSIATAPPPPDTSFMASMERLGNGDKAMGMGKLGLTAAGPLSEAFAPQPLSYDDFAEDSKYDPNRTLNLSMDTGINEALTKDSGLRLLAQGGYLDGGMLPGDGMSDDVPAMIDDTQEAALSQGEFVIPADVVSHLGNGSSDAGSKKLYAMMDKVRMARTGNKQQGEQINPERYMPA